MSRNTQKYERILKIITFTAVIMEFIILVLMIGILVFKSSLDMTAA